MIDIDEDAMMFRQLPVAVRVGESAVLVVCIALAAILVALEAF